MIIFFVLIALIKANLYSPHVYPKNGPFFEGWYMRMTSDNSKETYGFLFGKVLPKTPDQPYPLSYLSILRSKGDGTPMESYDVFPKDYKILVNGQSNYTNPDQNSPAAFEFWSEYGFFIINEDLMSWNFSLPQISFQGSGGNHIFWKDDQSGPAQWTDKLPLPLHWFVFSTGSDVFYYSFINKENSLDKQEGRGFMHMEKNWGESFPTAWIWGQAFDDQDKSGVLIAGGPLPGPLPIESHLIGYKNPQKNIQISFGPQNSLVSSSQSNQEQNCQGKLEVSASSMFNKLEISFSSSPNLFQTCLLGPSIQGFTGMCTESYETTVQVKVYSRGILGWSLIDEKIYQKAALEFGGNYMCQQNNPCVKQ